MHLFYTPAVPSSSIEAPRAVHSLTTLLQLMGEHRASLPLARQRALERAIDTQAVDVGLARLADAVHAADHPQLGRQIELRLEDDVVARAREREPRGVVTVTKGLVGERIDCSPCE